MGAVGACCSPLAIRLDFGCDITFVQVPRPLRGRQAQAAVCVFLLGGVAWHSVSWLSWQRPATLTGAAGMLVTSCSWLTLEHAPLISGHNSPNGS